VKRQVLPRCFTSCAIFICPILGRLWLLRKSNIGFSEKRQESSLKSQLLACVRVLANTGPKEQWSVGYQIRSDDFKSCNDLIVMLVASPEGQRKLGQASFEDATGTADSFHAGSRRSFFGPIIRFGPRPSPSRN
jgi:hypothetical protein